LGVAAQQDGIFVWDQEHFRENIYPFFFLKEKERTPECKEADPHYNVPGL
jgi:hypothetical protein